MKFRKIDEWEDHNVEPGGDEVMLLEAVDAPPNHLCYTCVSFSELSDEEFNALEDGKVVDLKSPDKPTDRS
jgi:uncharacterized protein YuzB (UPF0349 family)